MIKIEQSGVMFTADDGVPADFIAEQIECLEEDKGAIDEIKQEMKEKKMLEYDLTSFWHSHLDFLRVMVDDVLDPECIGAVRAIDDYWKEKIAKRLKK